MKSLSMILACAIAFAAAPALAADPAIEAPIRQFVTAFNKGDVAAARQTMAEDIHITDEVAPFFWGGHDAFARWSADYDKDAAAQGITGGKVVMGDPTRELIAGDRAYVIAPATYSFAKKGVAMSEVAQMTFALHRDASGWKIVSWTWTGPDPIPAPATAK